MERAISEIIGIYDADSSLVGEIRYWIGARVGRAHCSLCDLTHGLFTAKREWTECSTSLGVPVVTFHRDDAPAEVVEAAVSLPVVMARTTTGLVTVFDSARLESMRGSTTLFTELLTRWVDDNS